MTKRPSNLTGDADAARTGKATLILLAISVLFCAGSGRAQQVYPQCSGPGKAAEVAGIKFEVPQCFKLEPAAGSRVAFMRHRTEPLALFVVIADREVDDGYLTNLSDDLVSMLLPRQNGFSWKILQETSDRKISIYQTGRRTAKGLSREKYVQTDYVVLKARGRDLLTGSIGTFGTGAEVRNLYRVEGREYSFPGWDGLFKLIASVTGEREILAHLR